MGTPEATSILWPKVPPSQTWVSPQLQLNRERKISPGSLGERVCLLHPPLHAEESEHGLFTVFTSTVPHQTKANTTGGPSPREEAREAVSVCVYGGGVSARVNTRMHGGQGLAPATDISL